MKNHIISTLLLVIPMLSFADVVEIDGICYNLIPKGKVAEVTKKSSGQYTGDIVIPESVFYENNEYSVTKINAAAFYNCFDLTTVVIPNTVISIGNEAFYGCRKLASITIGNSVTEIGIRAFLRCALTSLTIPNSVNNICEEAFYDCSGLTSVTIGNSVSKIGNDAFYNCKKLTSVHISDLEAWCKITFVIFDNYISPMGMYSNPLRYAHHLFLNGEEIHDLIIPNTITSIKDYSFYNCDALSSVTIPSSVTSIGNNAFSGCDGLTSVDIANSVKSIGENAFNCESLKSVHISDLAAWCNIDFGIGKSNPLLYAHHLFLNGKEIKDLVIPNKVTKIGTFAFSGCSEITSVTIPNSVICIGGYAFSGCSALTSVTIPNSVENIEENAFNKCSSLTSVYLNNGIKSIDSSSFGNCPELTDFYCYSIKVPTVNYPQFTYDAFIGSYIEYATLHVPANSVEAYKSTAPWSNFGTIVAIEVPKHTLAYNVDGTTYKTYTIEEGETVSAEAEPTKEGYTFSGWSDIPSTMPDHDVTVTGSFTINKYKLTYMVDGEDYISSDVEYGATITPETAPTKEGYTFSGWSEIPMTMPAEDVTISGTFTINKYTITYIIDGEVFKSMEVEYNSVITPPDAPAQDGYDFAWADVPETMPASDITIYGAYTTGISSLSMEESERQVFTPDGKRVETPKKGLNIIRMNDGTVKKVVVK